MLEVGGVVHTGCEDHDGRIRHSGRGGRAEDLQKPRRIVRDRTDTMRREQFGEYVRHRASVLDDVRDSRRGTDIVFEHT